MFIMKYMKKAIIIFTIFAILLLMLAPVVNAENGEINAEKLKNISSPANSDSFNNISGKIIGVIYVVASFMSVATLIAIGVKYVTTSADQKASIKARAIPYVIGAVLVFGAANILRFIEKMSTWIQ